MDNFEPNSTPADIDLEASDWLARMDSDQGLSGQGRVELKAWLNRSSAHRARLHELVAFWQQANVLTELSFPLAVSTPVETERVSLALWPSLGVFASALVVMVVLVLGFNNDFPGSAGPRVVGNGIYETRIGEQNAITLRDGSVLELNTHSRVQVNYTESRREIRLMAGEVFFQVSKDRNRPFDVFASGGQVRAVGTAFAVRLNHDALTVTVTEGKVAVAEGELIAGQRVEFTPQLAQSLEAGTANLEPADLVKDLSWRKGLLMFNGESLSEVVKEMNRYSALTIEVVDPALADIKVGGQFRVGETEAMLTSLSASFNLDVLRFKEGLVRLVKKSPQNKL